MTPIEAACRTSCLTEDVDPDLLCPMEVEGTTGGVIYLPAWRVRETRVRAVVLAFLELATAEPAAASRSWHGLGNAVRRVRRPEEPGDRDDT